MRARLVPSVVCLPAPCGEMQLVDHHLTHQGDALRARFNGSNSDDALVEFNALIERSADCYLVGALEVSKKRTHEMGAVALAHPDGDPKGGGSQMYITLSARHELDSKYTVFGQVISGMDVVQKLRIPDRIIRVTVRDEAKK